MIWYFGSKFPADLILPDQIEQRTAYYPSDNSLDSSDDYVEETVSESEHLTIKGLPSIQLNQLQRAIQERKQTTQTRQWQTKSHKELQASSSYYVNWGKFGRTLKHVITTPARLPFIRCFRYECQTGIQNEELESILKQRARIQARSSVESISDGFAHVVKTGRRREKSNRDGRGENRNRYDPKFGPFITTVVKPPQTARSSIGIEENYAAEPAPTRTSQQQRTSTNRNSGQNYPPPESTTRPQPQRNTTNSTKTETNKKSTNERRHEKRHNPIMPLDVSRAGGKQPDPRPRTAPEQQEYFTAPEDNSPRTAPRTKVHKTKKVRKDRPQKPPMPLDERRQRASNDKPLIGTSGQNIIQNQASRKQKTRKDRSRKK